MKRGSSGRLVRLALAASGPTRLLGFWVNIRFFGGCGWRFRPYGEALFPDAEKVPKKACSCVRPSQARVPSLRDRSGRSGYGLLRCTYFRCVRLRRTVAALPRPDRSLRSAFRCRWLGKIKSTRAGAHCNEWLEAGGWLGGCGGFAPHRNAARPALSPRRGSRFRLVSKFEYDSISQVGAALASTPVNPLSLRERDRRAAFR